MSVIEDGKHGPGVPYRGVFFGQQTLKMNNTETTTRGGVESGAKPRVHVCLQTNAPEKHRTTHAPAQTNENWRLVG